MYAKMETFAIVASDLLRQDSVAILLNTQLRVVLHLARGLQRSSDNGGDDF